MRPSVHAVHDLVSSISASDALERAQRDDTLRWLESTDDVFRRRSPTTPARHLVSYVVLLDPADSSLLLVDHVKAGLWLPPGGHVEPDEHPAVTASRETREELGVEAVFASSPATASFVTVTETGGARDCHTDVSLWFLLTGRRGQQLTPDPREFTATRWWTPAQITAEDPAHFDPHLGRFMAKTLADT